MRRFLVLPIVATVLLAMVGPSFAQAKPGTMPEAAATLTKPARVRQLVGSIVSVDAQSKTVVVRAIGPSLSAAGINQPLNDPLVELHDGSGATLASNDNWQSGPNAAQIQSEGLAPAQPNEAALQATLNPGSYTAIVRSANGTSGVALVEVYDLSPAPN